MIRNTLVSAAAAFALVWTSMGAINVADAAKSKTKKVPVVMVMQAKGDITYSKNGTKWKKVRRNKFLFAGYQVKSGADSSATIINQAKNTSRSLGANSTVAVEADGAKLVTGSLSDPVAASGNLMDGLEKRFSKAQRYTTVRRGVLKVEQKTIKNLTLSSSFPNLVWQGFGPEYSFKLVVDGKEHTVAGTSDPVVRYDLTGLTPGEHSYRVEIIKDGAVVYKPKRDGTIAWLSKDEEAAYLASEEELRKASDADEFLIGAHRDEKGLTVAAMDSFEKYFADNPDDNDMRPMLIKVYFDLKLQNLRVKEAGVYNEMAAAEG